MLNEAYTGMTLKAWKDVLRRDPCAYCDQSSAFVDHIVARTSGGSNDPENFAGVCAQCNTQKSLYTLLAHLLRRGMQIEIDELTERRQAAAEIQKHRQMSHDWCGHPWRRAA